LTVATLAFPRYGETVYSETISAYLAGELGTLDDVDPHLPALLFAGDRLESLCLVEELRATHELVVLDRWTASNLAYQGARVADERRAAFLDWLRRIEHEANGVPAADAAILLEVPVTVAVAARAGRGPADLHEARDDYLERVAALYVELASAERWPRIPCSDDGSTLLPPAEIHDRIWRAVAPLL
jgi:dTMP kinase